MLTTWAGTIQMWSEAPFNADTEVQRGQEEPRACWDTQQTEEASHFQAYPSAWAHQPTPSPHPNPSHSQSCSLCLARLQAPL
jgi:hypothetical protein